MPFRKFPVNCAKSELVAVQINAADAENQDLIKNLASVTDAFNQAQQEIQAVINTVNGIAQVTSAMDNLVQEAIQLGTTAAKLSVA